MTVTDLALLVIRIVLGVIFLVHGGQKLFGWYEGTGIRGTGEMMKVLGTAHPRFLGWMAALNEFGGGVLVLFGLLTPLGAALIIGTMIVAVATVHLKNGFLVSKGGYEYNLSIIGLAIPLMLLGAGSLSVDHVLGIAMPINQFPEWVIIGLLLVPFVGWVLTDLSRRMNTSHSENLVSH